MSDTATKTAYLRGLVEGAKRLVPGIGGKLYSKHLGGNLATKGTAATMLNYAKGGAGFGAVAGGGIGALTAEDGHRWEGAARGAGSGAVQGAIGGAVSGAVNQPLRNLRQHSMAHFHGAPAAEKALNTTWRGNLKGMFAPGKGPGAVPRSAHAMEALAAPATIAADYVIGDMAMSAQDKATHALGIGEQPATPQVQPPSPQQLQYTPSPNHQVRMARVMDQPSVPELEREEPAKIEPFLVTPFTSTMGKILSDKAVKRVHPRMPDGAMRKHILPAFSAAAVTIPAVQAVRAYNESQAPVAPVNPLDELDLDALKT